MQIKETALPDPVISVDSTSNITLNTGPNEMLKVTADGFFVRGVKVPADEKESAAVYKAFKAFLVYHGLTAH